MAALRPRTRRLAIIPAAVLFLGTGVAFAYWTVTGTGEGSVATGDNLAITINQTSTIAPLVPGGAPQTLSGTFDNANEGPVYVTSVTASITGVTKAAGAPAGECDATDYTLADPTMTVEAEIPAGTGVGAWSGATIAFNNKADANQDGCKGATVTIGYESD